MSFLHRQSVRHPAAAVAVAFAVVAAAAPGILRLELRTDGHALVPPDRPEILLDQEVRDEFDAKDALVVVIRSEHPDGIYDLQTLQLVQDLTREIEAIEGIAAGDVTSLDTEYNHRVRPGTLQARRFLEPMPRTPQDLEMLRSDLERIRLYTGILVSRDGRSTSILVGVPKGVDRTALYATVQSLVSGHQGGCERIHVVGAPVAEAMLGHHILEDLGVPRAVLGVSTAEDDEAATEDSSRLHLPQSLHELRRMIARHIGLAPVAILIMGVVFAVSFRSLTAAALPLIEVGACLATVFGLMGWAGVPVYLTIAVMPVILAAIGVTDEIHVFARYAQEVQSHPERPCVDAVMVTLEEMWRPIVKTSVTTAVGFLSFALSPLPPVRAFGIFTSIGIVFCMLWSLSTIPAMLALLGTRRCAPSGISRPRRFDVLSRLEQLFRRLAGFSLAGRYAILIFAAVFVLLCPFGVKRLRVQDSWIDGFAPESAFYRATQFFNERFLGSHVLLLRLETPADRFTGEVPVSAIDHRQIVLVDAHLDRPDRLAGLGITLTPAQAPPTSPNPAQPAVQNPPSASERTLSPKSEGTTPPSRGTAASSDRSAAAPSRLSAAAPTSRSGVSPTLPTKPTSTSRSATPPISERRPAPRPTNSSPPPRRGTASQRPWKGRIAEARIENGQIVALLDKKGGSPKMAMLAAGAETVQYEIRELPLADPSTLREIERLEEFVEGLRDYTVGGVIGPASLLATANFMSRGLREEHRCLPADSDTAEWVWSQYARIRGAPRLRQTINEGYNAALVSVFLKDANFVDVGLLMKAIRRYEAEHLKPAGISLDFAGDVAVSQTLIDSIVDTQVRSLLGSLVGVLLVTIVLGRSLLYGILSALPCCLAVLGNFAFMGWMGIPLSVATSMFAGMTLGIGVDFAIHLIERYRLARRRGFEQTQAVADSLRHTGPAVLIDGAAVALGFGVLVLSQVPANARLGWLVVLSVACCVLWTVLLLPGLLTIRRFALKPADADS